jgi:hypothetical protein
VDLRAGLDDLEKRKFLTLPEFELRSLGRPARSLSLYRLSYPGSFFSLYVHIKSRVDIGFGKCNSCDLLLSFKIKMSLNMHR